MTIRVAVLKFPGTNCDLEMEHAIRLAGAEPDPVWHTEAHDLKDHDAAVVPGGFTYGDYVRAGAIAATSPALDALEELAEEERPILGVCNGMQILAERNLIPGTLTVNANNRFICTWTHLKVERTDTPFTTTYEEGQVIRVPIAHKEGRYIPDDDVENNVVFRFCGPDGTVSPEYNPNGSTDNITGVVNDRGNVLGMMPHPERAVHKLLGSDDGLPLFRSMIKWCRT